LRLKYKIQPQERHLPTRQELKTRQEADVIASLSLKFSGRSIAESHFQLARRLLASEGAETLVAGLLLEHLGNPEAATQAAASERRLERPRPALRPGLADTKRRGSSPTPGPRPRDVDATGPQGRDRHRGSRTRSRGTEHAFRYEVQDAPELTASSAEDQSPAQPHLPGVAPAEEAKDPSRAEPSTTDEGSDAGTKERYVNLFFGVGRRDGASSKDLEVVLSEAGIDQADLGRILVKHGHSLVQVAPHIEQHVIAKLNGSTICGREALVELARRRE
jgi:hypothetical protein